ncbi:CAAX amino terminal protease self- immunity [Gimesia chilikensis]|uniref:CAAX amino terminal protease self-immunity n=1 Tax=Gimesia chilikensis TaxID=2605989 RepID=A0A517WLH9_9PLAN|nr:CPBP family intramembrane glutamic endopeptidase [Gimesia chilikensis]QDU06112.1 CAAX amino terminal protease self- immunity [Gimesia chilikensis]
MTRKKNAPAETMTLESDSYWFEARQPLVCLVFLAPLLLIYELGVLSMGGSQPELIRNGADYWMRSWLSQLGLTQTFLLPCLIVGTLLVWHLCCKHPWKVSAETLVGMFAESLLFAFCLIVLGQVQDLVFQQLPSPVMMFIKQESASRVVSFVGAGVYEEVMFRLLLLPICYLLFRGMMLQARWSAVLAIISTSLIFSLAHYIGATGDQFSVFSFTFRTLAGLFFAGLFFLRGFGITVGAHATYDIIVGVMMLEITVE